ncbi:protein-disulfide reductase DsbD N-terminal domain-containing protein [Myxococcota bacterium]|nr:protein-disulfide reductase DsbD N-terminal domain-containing protein [Myxococcota bacterium]
MSPSTPAPSLPLLASLAALLLAAACGGGPTPTAEAPSEAPPAAPPPAIPAGGDAEPDFANALKFQPAGPLAAAEGGRLAGELVITLAPGFHVYGPNEPQSIPTSLTFEGDARVTYPPATAKDLGPLGRHEVYTGELRLPFTVPAPAAGAKELTGTLKYQVCTDKVCAFPETRQVAFPVAS